MAYRGARDGVEVWKDEWTLRRMFMQEVREYRWTWSRWANGEIVDGYRGYRFVGHVPPRIGGFARRRDAIRSAFRHNRDVKAVRVIVGGGVVETVKRSKGMAS